MAKKKTSKKTVKKAVKKSVPKVESKPKSKSKISGIDYSGFDKYKKIDDNTVEFECPNCGKYINIPVGTGQCPVCDFLLGK